MFCRFGLEDDNCLVVVLDWWQLVWMCLVLGLIIFGSLLVQVLCSLVSLWYFRIICGSLCCLVMVFSVFLLVFGWFLGVFIRVGSLSLLNSMVCNCLGEFRLKVWLVSLVVFCWVVSMCMFRFWFCWCSLVMLMCMLLVLMVVSIGISGILMLWQMLYSVGIVSSCGCSVWCRCRVMLVFLVVQWLVLFRFIWENGICLVFLLVMFLNLMVVQFRQCIVSEFMLWWVVVEFSMKFLSMVLLW